MTSDSAKNAASRPFYAAFAQQYDDIIDAPVEPWVDTVAAVLAPGGSVLDAGCGTGRHALALAARGFEVEMLDASEALLAVASARLPEVPAHLADICNFDLGRTFDAIACRGVLNDILTDTDRLAALTCMARQLAPGGALVLDVRHAAAVTADGQPRTTEATGISFTSTQVWDDPWLRVSERHEMNGRSVDNEFVMRPWTSDELRNSLSALGRDAAIAEGRQGRLTVIARSAVR